MTTIGIRLRWLRLKEIRYAIIQLQQARVIGSTDGVIGAKFALLWLDAAYRRDYGTKASYVNRTVTSWLWWVRHV